MSLTQYITEYKSYVLLLVAVCIFALFGMYKAYTSGKKRRIKYQDEEAKIKRLTYLKNEFSSLSRDALLSKNKEDLTQGVALHIQLKIEKTVDDRAFFEALPIEAKVIYTLDIFMSEYVSLSEFYRVNGVPLTKLLAFSFNEIGQKELFALVKETEDMFDEDREDTSVDAKRLSVLDEEFNSVYKKEWVNELSAQYILRNAEKFSVIDE